MAFECAQAAADCGQPCVLRWLHRYHPESLHSIELAMRAARAGQEHLLMAFRKRDPPCPIRPVACIVFAAHGNQLAALQWLHASYPEAFQQSHACNLATRLGVLEALQCLRRLNLAPWDITAGMPATLEGHINILE